MMPYFRMNNEILDLGLTPNEIKVAVYLYSCVFKNCFAVQIKQSTIAEKCGINCFAVQIKQSTIAEKCGIKREETVGSIVCKLQRKGIIERVKRPVRANGRLGTYIYKLRSVSHNGYFKVYRYILGKLTGVQLRMYLFVCRAVTKKNDMWNSFNDISRALQISKNKIVSVIKELVELGFIIKTKVMKKDGSYSDNHYSITKPEVSNDSENKKVDSAQMTTMAEITEMVFFVLMKLLIRFLREFARKLFIFTQG